jgi:predicted GNAT family N-acyltransferase
MIYAPISREHDSYRIAHSGIVKHTNKKVKRDTWSYFFPKKKDSESFSKHLPKNTKDELMWVCYDGGKIIGVFLIAINNDDEVMHPMLVVHEDYRGIGVGTSLSKLAVASFKGTYPSKPMRIKISDKNRTYNILSKIGFKKVGTDKIPILDMNGEPTTFKEIAILEI